MAAPSDQGPPADSHEHGSAGSHSDEHGDHAASGHEMAGMVAPSPAAYVADDRSLERRAWTATEQVGAGPEGTRFLSADEAVDDDPASVWRASTGTPAVLTVDLGSSGLVLGLDYVAPGDGVGAITQFEVAVSTDGTSWRTVADGRWPDDGRAVPTEFEQVEARFVRLTALETRDGRSPAVADLDLRTPKHEARRGAPAPRAPEGRPSVVGRWSRTIAFPLVPVAVAALPGNRLLTWSAYATDDYDPQAMGYTQTAILDLDTMKVSRRLVTKTRHDMFCPGVAMLPDGRIMVTGGSNANQTSIYDPKRDTWKAGPPMKVGRGYHAMTTMPDGRVFTVGGSWGPGGLGGKVGEVWSQRAGWRRLAGVSPKKMLTDDPAGIFRQDNQMWLYPVADRKVLQVGPSQKMNVISLRGRGSVRTVGKRPGSAQMNGNAVMYAPHRILVLGGAPAYDETPSVKEAFTIDIRGKRPRVRRTGSMIEPRTFANSVVLPDGQVVAVGGQARPLAFSDVESRYRPEIWSPRTGRFHLGASMAVPRNYHSVAVLLPDGRVFSGGGGLCGDCETNHFNGQIYTPGYLLRDDGRLRARPRITRAPRTARLGSQITVRTRRGARSFSLVRMAEATHTVNNSQRRIPLRVVRRAGARSTLRLPADASVLLPGNYMLFAMDRHGTPSRSRLVRVPVR
ncbi:galactose oxidase-like domain-containing protein [Nocardioides sp. 503]|uniref:galactose oxidase-like domain-containing protein n=1 Tax=Nocardioides sp. 503 TaxID=2508326 RepID=UPI00107058F3|nr:galactose oxidase-like domain-containing protein [Nocardioides sp. 503]